MNERQEKLILVVSWVLAVFLGWSCGRCLVGKPPRWVILTDYKLRVVYHRTMYHYYTIRMWWIVEKGRRCFYRKTRHDQSPEIKAQRDAIAQLTWRQLAGHMMLVSINEKWRKGFEPGIELPSARSLIKGGKS